MDNFLILSVRYNKQGGVSKMNCTPKVFCLTFWGAVHFWHTSFYLIKSRFYFGCLPM